MENIHSDIVENILDRLPIEAALYAKRVSKTWREILRDKTEKQGLLFCHGVKSGYSDKIGHQLFYEDEYDHYDHAEMNYYDSYDTLSKIEHGEFITRRIGVVIGSCNGLVCLAKDNKSDLAIGADPFLICNPLTGESVFLPEYNYSELPKDIPTPIRLAGSRLSSGFGYCPLTNAYKVVTIYYYEGATEYKGHVQVYTIGGEWRYIGLISRLYTLQDSSGIYANGALYWLHQYDRGALHWLHNIDSAKVKECEILAFDLEGEKHSSIPLPLSRDFDHEYPYFNLLGGNNNLYLIHKNRKASRIDIWKLNYCKSSSYWIREFSIKLEFSPYHITPFSITKNNEVLLWYKFGGLILCRYDSKTSNLNILWEDKLANNTYIEAVPHKQSIVSLIDLGETNVTCFKDFVHDKKSKRGAEKIVKKSRGTKRKKNW